MVPFVFSFSVHPNCYFLSILLQNRCFNINPAYKIIILCAIVSSSLWSCSFNQVHLVYKTGKHSIINKMLASQYIFWLIASALCSVLVYVLSSQKTLADFVFYIVFPLDYLSYETATKRFIKAQERTRT